MPDVKRLANIPDMNAASRLILTTFLGAIPLAASVGCDEEPVRTYRVPKPHVVDPTAGRMHQTQQREQAPIPRDQPAEPPMAMRDGEVPATPPAAEITYDVPAGWVEQDNLGSMRVAAFDVGDGDRQAELTVIPLPASVFEMNSNVNRWAGQVGLQPMSPEQVRRIVKPFEPAAPNQAFEVDLPGDQQRIFAIMVLHAGQVWFYKMTGPTDLVGEQIQTVRDFVAGVGYEAAE